MATNAALILKDPEIRKYFLSVLQSSLSDDEKYERFIDFFDLESQVKNQLLSDYGEQLLTMDTSKLGEIVAAASQTIGVWKPDEILRETHQSIRRALQRLKNSQHRDGGWGFQVEVSHPWGTAYAVLCLNAARQVSDLDIEIEDNLNRGLEWLKERSQDWSTEIIELHRSRSVYDVAIVIRACYEAAQAGFPSVENSWRRLLNCQNHDGGWDARIWPDDYSGPSRVFSDVGATSTAIQALVTVKKFAKPELDFEQSFLKGLDWFIETQNDDGSWNNKSCTSSSKQIEGVPSITKTCDAIKGILTVKDLFPRSTEDGPPLSMLERKVKVISHEEYHEAGSQAVDEAVNWLLSQEKPLYDRNGNISGWGWGPEMIGDQRIADIENTWLTLETLVQIESPSISLPLLAGNAQWLMKQQHQAAPDEDPVEDGKWEPRGHTARIALSLIEFYKKIEGSPVFMKTPARQSATQSNQ